MNATTTPQTVPGCEVRIVHLDYRVESFRLPVSAEEALKSCVLLERLSDYADWSDLWGSRRDFPLAVAIHRSDDRIIVHLHAEDDLEAARAEAEAVLAGEWRAKL